MSGESFQKGIPSLDLIKSTQKSMAYAMTELNYIDLLQISEKPWQSFNQLIDILQKKSPYLNKLIETHNTFIVDFIHQQPDIFWQKFLSDINTIQNTTKDDLFKNIRILKQKAILFIALCDLGRIWSLEKATQALSNFADEILKKCLTFLFNDAYHKDLIETPILENGYFIIAMGKWGSFELNYSSDIDFIIFYDPSKLHYKGKNFEQNFIIKLSQQLVQLLEEETEEGFVFRTDLRLRPDPYSFPIAITTQSAEIYYQSRAETWERSAYIKARIAAGDITRGQEFLNFLRPFIWRKYLDFASIQDIQNLRHRILSTRPSVSEQINNFNIKLGPGGIREIEFFAQSQQLIWGGRNPILREPQTLTALNLLSTHGFCQNKETQILTQAYIFFRDIEHRLQLINNAQTHDLPETKDEWEAIQFLAGYNNIKIFQEDIKHLLLDTERIVRKLFMELAPQKNETFYLKESENDETTHMLLKEVGYKNTENVLRILKTWHHGQYRVLRNEKARTIIEHMTHDLLKIFAETKNPDLSLQRFDNFLANLPMGVQLFSLFQARPKLLKLLTNIIGNSPYLSDLICQFPTLFDLTLLPSFYTKISDKIITYNKLQQDLEPLPDFQSKLDFLQHFRTEKKFQIGVHILEELSTSPEKSLTILADIIIEALAYEVAKEFKTQQGVLPGLNFAIISFGSLGASEMTLGSDLDLVFIYDIDENIHVSDHSTLLSPAHYMSRFCKRLLTGLTSIGKNGKLYEVDVRLRPTGNSGPIIHTFESFKQYYETDAWIWEIMALTKARIICGNETLCQKLNTLLSDFLTQKRNPNIIKNDLLDMRERIRIEKGQAENDLMHRPGGIVDFNFLIQYLKLIHAPKKGFAFPQNTLATLEIFEAKSILQNNQIDQLKKMYRHFLNWRHYKALKIQNELNEAILNDVKNLEKMWKETFSDKVVPTARLELARTSRSDGF